MSFDIYIVRILKRSLCVKVCVGALVRVGALASVYREVIVQRKLLTRALFQTNRDCDNFYYFVHYYLLLFYHRFKFS